MSNIKWNHTVGDFLHFKSKLSGSGSGSNIILKITKRRTDLTGYGNPIGYNYTVIKSIGDTYKDGEIRSCSIGSHVSKKSKKISEDEAMVWMI